MRHTASASVESRNSHKLLVNRLALGLIESAGNFWLIGGVGHDSTKPQSYLNHLWKYGP
jgi:hypothetical protein